MQSGFFYLGDTRMERPWFKFTANNWLSGSVQLLSDAEKGTYIDLIAMIWKEGGRLENTKVLHRKLRLDHTTACDRINSYCELDILVCEDGYLSIKFLSDQIDSYKTTCENNAKNASKRWAKSDSSMRPNANKKRKEEKREEEKRKDKKTEQKSLAIDPNETTKPKPDAFMRFFEIYPKPFNAMCIYTKNAFFEAVSIADGEDPILVNASMYANYFEKAGKPIQYALKAQEWLETQSWRTDWNAELKKHQNQNSPKLSTSGVSEMTAETKF
jgi:hypothetical protein